MNIENEVIYGFGMCPNISCGTKHCVCEFDLDKLMWPYDVSSSL